MCRRAQNAGRRPGGMLGLEEAPELLRGDVDPEMAEQLADEAGVLDLLQCPGDPEERLVVLAEAARNRVRLRQAVAPQRLEPRTLSRLDELRVVPELHQRVSPVEEDCAEHAKHPPVRR